MNRLEKNRMPSSVAVHPDVPVPIKSFGATIFTEPDGTFSLPDS
jgi:hypothetical protein